MIDKYWDVKARDISFNGRREYFREMFVNEIFMDFIKWREHNQTIQHFKNSYPSLKYFRNELLEKGAPSKLNEYIINLYTDDDAKSVQF